uniref:Uncharacterized protein n=1 Tax=Arundo donax TaxID=35708 RepID=A0A0A9B066_ARUDO
MLCLVDTQCSPNFISRFLGSKC